MKFALIGHPVSHSLSPVIHQAAYRELGAEHEYGLIDCQSLADVERVVAALRAGELAGVNITIPWKRAAYSAADRRSPLAERLQVANVLGIEGGQLVAHNTDALALEVEFSRQVTTRRAVVLGSGGAVPAVVAACRAAGIAEVFVTARRYVAEAARESWPEASELSALGAEVVAWPSSSPAAAAHFEQLCEGAGLVVQGTSAGMHGADSGEAIAALVPWSRTPADALAYDLIYAPLETPFLRVARAAGRRTAHGLSMLVGQAALAIEIWLGQRPPLEPLLSAALQALAKRRAV
ncbi:MAG TPA: shikimate dehydrogenase [Polyangiaceae bacterium]|nr:shikimate dehydrogenase [Polyangiaceae bacterium]